MRGQQGDALTDERRWLVIATTAVGALAGCRILGLLEQAPRDGWHWDQLLVPGGKTIVGGLLGGWLAVEIVKRCIGIRSRTGDLFAVPLCVGIAIGRIGCFLAGLADDTYGTPTSLPWGVNFGRRYLAPSDATLRVSVSRGIRHDPLSLECEAPYERRHLSCLHGGVSWMETVDRLHQTAAAGPWPECDSMGVHRGPRLRSPSETCRGQRRCRMFDQLETGRSRLSAPMTLMAMSVTGLFVTFVICVISATGQEVFVGLYSKLAVIALEVSALGVAVSVLWFFVAMIIGAIRR